MHSLRPWITLISIVTMIALVGLAGFTALSKAQGGETTTRVSVASDGTEGNQESFVSFVSGDGKYVVFTSLASNLVVGDTNAVTDVFLRNIETGVTTRESLATNETQANGESSYATITANGQYIAFSSTASNLVPNDNNNQSDVFLRDQISGNTERVSITDEGGEADNFSGTEVDISLDGRFVVFPSLASNLVATDTNGYYDIFIRDRSAETTTRISVASNGMQANEDSFRPRISADGRYVVFESEASNLVVDDTNNQPDIFVHDRLKGNTRRVSVDSIGIQANHISGYPDISSDGRYVAFQSRASNLVTNDTNNSYDIFVHDQTLAITQRVSISSTGEQGNDSSRFPYLSANGKYVAFRSVASNLILSDNNDFQDNFIFDRITQETVLVSLADTGIQGNANSNFYTSISDDGTLVSFDSFASNLVVGDTNNTGDIFVRELGALASTPTPTPTPTQTRTPTVTNTPPPGATLTPTPTTTPAVSDEEVYIPLVLRQYAFATPLPTTPTPTVTPQPVCEVVDHEPNNLFLEADNNLSLCQGGVVNGVVAPTTDVNDIYRIIVEQAGPIAISLTNIPPGADYDLYLYDTRGGSGQIAVSNTSGSANEEIRVAVSSGRHYIRVVSLDYAGANTYQLRWARE